MTVRPDRRIIGVGYPTLVGCLWTDAGIAHDGAHDRLGDHKGDLVTAPPGLLAQLLGALGVVDDTPRPPRAEPTPPVLDVPTMLGLLEVWLSPLVPDAPELAPALDIVHAEQADPAPTDPAPEVFEIAVRMARIDAAFDTVVAAGPVIAQLVSLQDPAHYLPDVRDPILTEIRLIRRMYSAVIVTELRSVLRGTTTRAMERADAAMAALPGVIRDQYLGPRGIAGQIVQAERAWSQLRELRAELGLPAGSSTADRYAATEHPDPATGGWALRDDLDQALGRARSMRDVNDAGTADEVTALVRQLQAVTGALGALTLRDQLATGVDQLIAYPDLKTRVRGYVTELDAIITTLGNALGDAQSGDPKRVAAAAAAQVAGVAALSELLARPAVATDGDTLVSTLGWQNAVKVALLATLVVAAASLTAGAAGAAVAAIAGEATVLGVGVAGVGAFVAETVWFTIVVRAGNEALLGPASIAESSFAEELLWNAAMIGGLKAVESGFARVFVQVVKADTAAARIGFIVARTAVAQVSLLAFAELQSLLKRGRLLSLSEFGRAALQNIVMTVALGAGRLLATSFAERLTGVPEIDPVRLQLLDARRANVQSAFGKVADGTATAAEREQYLRDAHALWTDFLALVDTLPAGDPRVAQLIEPFARARFELELRLAMIGMASPDVAGLAPMVRPVRSGVVALAEEARARLDDFYADRGGQVDTTALPGVLVGTLPGGHRAVYLTLALPERAPTAAELAIGRVPGLEEAAFDDVAAAGLLRLTSAGFSAETIDTILAAAGPRQVDFLRLLSHPQFAAAQTLRSAGGPGLSALAGSGGTLDFARAYGPDLARLLVRRFGSGAELVRAQERAAALLEAAAPADRPQLTQELAGLDTLQLRLRLGTAVRKPRVSVSKDSLGIDRGSVQWRTLREEVGRTYAGLPAAQLDLRADLDQVLAVAHAKRFEKITAHDTRLAMLDRFDQLCLDAGLSIGSRNGRRGLLAELLFIPGRGRRLIFFQKNEIKVAVVGSTVPDDWYLVDGVRESLELKSDLVHLMTLTDLRALARGYLVDARGDAENLPDGSRYGLWFIRDPGSAGRQAMMDELSAAGSPITRVRFGGREWQPVVAAP
jgi:hypothetical protein